MDVQICPSILSCDFSNLRSELAKIATGDWAHVDVMDGHFVPNLTIGVPVVEAMAGVTQLPLDCHLMIDDPDRWAPDYAKAGAKRVTFHAEAAHAPVRLARELRAMGVQAGIAVKPATPIEPFLEYLDEFDLLLIMTVEPGFGGQKFISQTLPKIARARKAISESGQAVSIQVDGGISRSTITAAARAGADSFVAGSAVFHSRDAAAEIAALRELAR